jgi:hypothetical protein
MADQGHDALTLAYGLRARLSLVSRCAGYGNSFSAAVSAETERSSAGDDARVSGWEALAPRVVFD